MIKKTSPKYLLVIALFAIAALALTACGNTPANQAQSAAGGTVDVLVTVNEYSVESSVSIFDVGVPYHFTVVNEGADAHELMLIPQLDESITGVKAGSGMEPGTMMDMENSEEMEARMEILDGYALAVVEEDDLGTGVTSTFDYIFTESVGFGELEFACYIPGHYEEGMFLPIMVQ